MELNTTVGVLWIGIIALLGIMLFFLIDGIQKMKLQIRKPTKTVWIGISIAVIAIILWITGFVLDYILVASFAIIILVYSGIKWRLDKTNATFRSIYHFILGNFRRLATIFTEYWAKTKGYIKGECKNNESFWGLIILSYIVYLLTEPIKLWLNNFWFYTFYFLVFFVFSLVQIRTFKHWVKLIRRKKKIEIDVIFRDLILSLLLMIFFSSYIFGNPFGDDNKPNGYNVIVKASNESIELVGRNFDRAYFSAMTIAGGGHGDYIPKGYWFKLYSLLLVYYGWIIIGMVFASIISYKLNK